MYQYILTNQKYFVYLFFSTSTSTRQEDQTNSVGPWPSEWAHLDKPVLLDQLNLILNLNQARGLNQLSWTLTIDLLVLLDQLNQAQPSSTGSGWDIVN